MKEQAREYAIKHHADMERLFANETADAVHYATIWGYPHTTPREVFDRDTKPTVKLLNLDTVSALFEVAKTHEQQRITVLNFASYKEPGGRFMNGSLAQEECLCRQSNLYEILSRFQAPYYGTNLNIGVNRALYMDRALHVGGVIFHEMGDYSKQQIANVVTCAAPNFSPGKRYGSVTEDEDEEAMSARVSFLHRVLNCTWSSIVILGAWGCGVFKQDPAYVAECFKSEFYLTHNVKEIYYAVPGHDANYEAFAEAFGD